MPYKPGIDKEGFHKHSPLYVSFTSVEALYKYFYIRNLSEDRKAAKKALNTLRRLHGSPTSKHILEPAGILPDEIENRVRIDLLTEDQFITAYNNLSEKVRHLV